MLQKIPDIKQRNIYWNKRFQKGIIYTDKPSKIIKSPIIQNYFKKQRTKNILIIGGGYGRNAIFLSQKGYEVFNNDISQRALNIGKKLFGQYNIKFIKDDILKTKNENNSFDSVVCFYLLSLFTDKEINIALKNIKKILKPTGILICNFLSKDDDEFKFGKKINENILLYDDNKQLINFYSLERIKILFRKNKLKINDIFKAEERRVIKTWQKTITSRSWVVIANFDK